LGLRVKNTQTSKNEAYFDHLDNDRALLQMMKQFGTVQGNYVIVDPHRRQWEYAVAMRLPFTGKGELRHYQRSDKNQSGKFVDATEPRWFIQEPYPPEAWDIDAAIALNKQRTGGGIAAALKHCRSAISDLNRVDWSEVRVDLDSATCQQSAKVQQALAFERSLGSEFKLLQRIKKEVSHE
jgi:hypothetical protein